MRRLSYVFLLAAAPACAAAPTGEAALGQMIAGRTAGQPQDCLSRTGLMGSTRVDGIGLVYGRGRTIYVNRFDKGCPGLSSNTAVVTSTPSGQLCRGDIARLVDPMTRMSAGSCVLGPFVPYTKGK